MTKQRPVQKLVAVGAAVLAIALVTEGYLQVREFVVATQQSSREVARLRNEVETMHVMLENMPHGPVPQPYPTGSFAELPPPVPATAFPLPEPAAAKPKASAGPRLTVNTDKAQKTDGATDSDTVVLLNGLKATPADPKPDSDAVVLLNTLKAAPAYAKPQPAATPSEPAGVDVKLATGRK